MKLRCDLWLVVEIEKDEKLHKSIIVEPSSRQFYRTVNLHERDHFQLRGEFSVHAYTRFIERRGLVRVEGAQFDGDDVDADNQPRYCVLSQDENHVLQDIVVLNFEDDPELVALADRVRLAEHGHHLLSSGGRKKLGKNGLEDRGNLRVDIGFCAQSHNDKSVVPGMNVPRFTTWADSKPGLAPGESLTVSVILSACAMKHFVERAKEKLGVSWNDFEGVTRRTLFPHRAASDRGVENSEDFDSEGVSLSVTGTMADGSCRILNRHRDSLNSREESHCSYRGLSMIDEVHYEDWSHPVGVRFTLGEYGKKCIDDAMKRHATNGNIFVDIQRWRNNNPELFWNDPRLLEVEGPHRFRFIRPRADKSVYYSIFIHGIRELGKKLNYDKGVMFEAVMAMSFTPSPSGWYTGLKHVLVILLEKLQRGESANFITLWIDYMVTHHKCVSWGHGRRRQVSHGRSVSEPDLFKSLRNMMRLSHEASLSTDTKSVMRRWTSKPEKGGLFGVGDLVGQEQVYVLTSFTAIESAAHIGNTFVGCRNKTAERLAGLGVKTQTHRRELVRFLAVNMELPELVVENSLCEWQREVSRRGNGARVYFDTIVRGQNLYLLQDGELFQMDKEGVVTAVDDPTWDFDNIDYYEGAVRWWDDEVDLEVLRNEINLTAN